MKKVLTGDLSYFTVILRLMKREITFNFLFPWEISRLPAHFFAALARLIRATLANAIDITNSREATLGGARARLTKSALQIKIAATALERAERARGRSSNVARLSRVRRRERRSAFLARAILLEGKIA